MARLKCFVAMAFGRKDCDELYRKQIIPVLKALHLEPIRVDQRQHRDDLNTFIIRMLNESQIAIVDLTYARPSVYYEAGYAERAIPVAYISRKDHLSRAQPDERLRVHFDLEMKKIIDWVDSSDCTFSHRLSARLRYLLKPLVEESKHTVEVQQQREKFESISVAQRLETIRTLTANVLRNYRFWTRTVSELMPTMYYNLNIRNVNIGVKMVGRTCKIVIILAEETYSPRQLQDAIYKIALRVPILSERIDKYQIDCFFFALKSPNSARLMKALPHAHKINEHRFLIKFDIENECIIHIPPTVTCPADIAVGVREMRSVLSRRKTNKTTVLVDRKDSSGSRAIQFTRRIEPGYRLYQRVPRRWVHR
ncbi:MAG: hypothetical protein HY964_02650 [Ignavibacteriales bacterium]|nr:hypothetical protein [Ignavibacteriales bacterium]